MPIHSPIATRRVSQNEFKAIASEVMRHVFDIHNEFGRMFDEFVYKKELRARMPEVVLELPFRMVYFQRHISPMY